MSDAAAIWSAIAASCSAIAAIVMTKIERRNMFDSVRPELILIDWDRKNKEHGGGARFDEITFNKIKNVGKGSALHIFINLNQIDNPPKAAMTSKRVSVLPVEEEKDVNGKITLFWDNVDSKDNDFKHLPINIKIYSLCSKGYRHETVYSIMIVKSSKNCILTGGEELAEGVILSTRKTYSKPLWRLKILSKLARLPIIRKYMIKDR